MPFYIIELDTRDYGLGAEYTIPVWAASELDLRDKCKEALERYENDMKHYVVMHEMRRKWIMSTATGKSPEEIGQYNKDHNIVNPITAVNGYRVPEEVLQNMEDARVTELADWLLINKVVGK